MNYITLVFEFSEQRNYGKFQKIFLLEKQQLNDHKHVMYLINNV